MGSLAMYVWAVGFEFEFFAPDLTNPSQMGFTGIVALAGATFKVSTRQVRSPRPKPTTRFRQDRYGRKNLVPAPLPVFLSNLPLSLMNLRMRMAS